VNDEMTRWHADPEALRDYADRRANAAVAWSIETHVLGCSSCREALAELLSADDAAILAEARTAVRLGRTRPRRSSRATVTEGVLGPWWSWVSLVVAGVVILRLADRLSVPVEQAGLGLSWTPALSPLIPVAMVATVYGLADRDAAAQAAPRGGFELVLIRTATVLAVTIPVVTATLWAGGAFVIVWLLPALGLSVGAVALGSWFGVERAALGLTALWAVVVVLAMVPASGLAEPLARLINPDGPGRALWGALVIVAGLVLVRRTGFDVPRRLR